MSPKDPKPDLEAVERRLLAMLPAGFLVLSFLLFHKITASVAAPYNWTRLQRTFLLAHGEKIYTLSDGPAVLAMYGPVSALVYWPATWMHSLSAMMQTASILNISFFLLPVLWLCLSGGENPKRNRLYSAAVFLIFAFFPFMTSSLRDAAFNVHADASALGFSALACAALLGFKNKNIHVSLCLSALCAALAFWSKQVTAPLSLALLSYVGFRIGRREFFYYLTWLFLFGVVVSGIIFKVFGFQELWFNLVTIPAHQPFRDASEGGTFFAVVYKLFHESFFVILFSFVVFIFSRSRVKNKPGSLFLWVAVFLLPMAILGKLKVGAANNVFCYVSYFLLIAAVLALAELNVQGYLRRFTNLLLAGLILVQAGLVFYKYTVPPPGNNFAQTAYDYVKKYPGEAYFPRLTLVHLLVEGKVTHESVALIDRHWAGIPLKSEQLRAFIPPGAKFIAFYEAAGDDRHWLDLPEFSVKTLEPELPGYVVYKRSKM